MWYFLGCNDGSKFKIKEIVQDEINQYGTGSSTIRQTKNIYDEYQKIIKENNSIDYIGEWHTHPTGKVSPSHYDNIAMKFLLNHPKYSYPRELILGIVRDDLKVFHYQYGIQKMKELNLRIK